MINIKKSIFKKVMLTSETEKKTGKIAAIFSFGQIADITAYQSFTLLIFTFYYSVVGIQIDLIMTGFIIWSIWNMFNDPFLGYFSDRTHTKWGRRRPWIMIAFIPLSVIMVFLFTPPLPIGIVANQTGNFIYFLIIIIIFELFYTMYSLNVTSLFPEIFLSEKERTQGNNIRAVYTIVGLIVAFILPGLIIPDFTDPAYFTEFQIFGIIAGIVIAIAVIILLRFGPREKKEFQKDYEKAFSLFNSVKYCIKSKSFRWYIIAEIGNWFVYGMLPVIVPLYAKFVLGTIGFGTSLLLGLTFISAAIFMTVLWKPLVRKMGNKKSWIISMSIWGASLLPLMFISDFTSGLIVFFLIGVGLSGSLYIIDLVVADIVDEDEVATGLRREAGYYGVNAFFLRFANVLVILAIGSVFSGAGWAEYTPNPGVDVIFGLRSLMFIFPVIALIISIIAMTRYPLHGENLKDIQEKLKKIHEEKKARM
ncbi:MAG: MFS transporter [Candidatus Lokiarchaeota archaeon]|nr:MFS transporter [Candidatus Lokiarchaeota archaeon]